MDITFHYFAVKTLALEAGFPGAEAQRLAAFSQFVDDFDRRGSLYCGNVPRYIRLSRDHDLYSPGGSPLEGNFEPVTTGSGGLADFASLLLPRAQKFTLAPFHFLPASPRADWADCRTVPARLGDGSHASSQLLEARAALLSGRGSRRAALMRIGIYLHSFADTYAHQLFSGGNSWVNDVLLESVTENAGGTDVTAAALGERELTAAECFGSGRGPEDWRSILPRIGHMWAGRTPDRANLSFTLRYRASADDPDYSLSYSRSNTALFLEAAEQILNYLQSCRRLPPVSAGAWASLSSRLEQAFLLPAPERDAHRRLASRWSALFPGYVYAYDPAVIEASFRPAGGDSYSEDFYLFNYIAEEPLIRLYGPKPRRRT